MNGKNRAKIKKEIKLVKTAGKEIGKDIKKVEENIVNVPNFFTTLRVLITLVIIYIVFAGFALWIIALFFVAGMITDFLDGNIARIFNQKTEFGRKYDLIADRFLFAGTIISVLVHFTLTGYLGSTEIIQIVLVMSREIVGLPAAIWALFSGNITPRAKVIGKTTTVLQAFAFPIVILKLNLAWHFAIVTGVVGLLSGIRYIIDVGNESEK